MHRLLQFVFWLQTDSAPTFAVHSGFPYTSYCGGKEPLAMHDKELYQHVLARATPWIKSLVFPAIIQRSAVG